MNLFLLFTEFTFVSVTTNLETGLQTGLGINEHDLQVCSNSNSNQPHGGAAHPLTQNQRIKSFIKLVEISETSDLDVTQSTIIESVLTKLTGYEYLPFIS